MKKQKKTNEIKLKICPECKSGMTPKGVSYFNDNMQHKFICTNKKCNTVIYKKI